MAKGWSLRKKYIGEFATRYGVALVRNTSLQIDSNLSDLRRFKRELLHDMPPARQETWLRETAEAQAAVSARVSRRLEERRLRARARRVEQNERSSKYFYRRMKAKNPAKCVSDLLAANGELFSAPEAI
ncbi:hypothetical protein IWW57_002593 [Coemansia sp. S610]|nr:hypothetical protein IWW57_002593 [Coemansia sp. S610]